MKSAEVEVRRTVLKLEGDISEKNYV